jgi:hypothetical protein
MAQQSSLSARTETELATAIASYYADPYGWVMFSYPWGKMFLPDGSLNPLRDKKGPEPWQKRLLIQLGKHIQENADLKKIWSLLDYAVWRSAVASGHGVGKSAIVSWIIQFLMSTRADTRGIVTASTQRQLEDKTWPELSKWHNLLINKHWFTWTATTYYFAQYPDDKRKNYMVTAMTVSAENTEAFAGLHNEAGTVFVILDEASGVAPKVWEVSEGALTDGEGFFFAFGNPTQPTGEFADCFGEHKHMYYTEFVDSRDVSHTNKSHLQELIKKWGIDSDEVKVRVLGQFPNQAFNGFIGIDMMNDAIERQLYVDHGAALIMAVDVAHMGDDSSVIFWRQGHDARSRPMMEFKNLNTVRLAKIIMDEADRHRPDVIVIEMIGPGIGVTDILRDRGYKVVSVYPGAPSGESLKYSNVRAELYCKMRDALAADLCVSDDKELYKQATSIQYGYAKQGSGAIKIEEKEGYKSRTQLGSPDKLDGLMLTFGTNVARRDTNLTRRPNEQGTTAVTEYDLYAY